MADAGQGCVKPAGGPVAAASPPPPVGHQAPDFEANVYYNGGFQTMKLSDYKGKWIVLCFYPGDFTFV